MDKRDIKDSVIDGYGKIARHSDGGILSKLFACCNREETIKEVSNKIGYSETDLQAVPDGANLGIGCGNPLALSKIKEGDTVLDLGSGAGFDCFLAAPLVGETGKVIGVDITEDMIKKARNNAKKSPYNNIKFIKGDIEDLPIDDETVDLIISNCVLNLSTQKQMVFKEANRVLKPKGSLTISDIVLLKDLPDFIKDSIEGHIACIAGAEKIENYFHYAEQAGFKEVRIDTKTKFPLELIMTDPIVQKMVKDFEMTEAQIIDISNSITSITLSAKK